MDNSVHIFRLDEVLEIIDIEQYKLTNVDNLEISAQQKILDYLEIEKRCQEVGEIGEEYIYNIERERLLLEGSKYAYLVSRKPSMDPKNGYDIDSYTSTGKKIFIEVKSTSGDCKEPFYLTANERNKAKCVRKNGGIYKLYRVYNVGKESINFCVYDDDLLFKFEEILYRVEVL